LFVSHIFLVQSGLPLAIVVSLFALTRSNHPPGKTNPMAWAAPESDATGTIKPEKFWEGKTDRIAVPKTAATWVLKS